VNPLYLVKHRIDALFVADQLCQRDPRKRVLDYLVQPDDHRPDAAIALVHAAFEHARVAFAVLIQNVFVEHLDYLAEQDLIRRTRQK
jgi:hypothetical protein